MGLRALSSILLSAIFTVTVCGISSAAFAQSLQGLTTAERQVCKDLDMCVDVMLRHDKTEFDYAVLAAEFQRLGPQGSARLLRTMQSERPKASRNALDILLQGGWQFSSQEQSSISRMWPKVNVAALMATISSPMMRDRFIETLNDDNPEIRAASRFALSQIGQQKNRVSPLPPQAFAGLAKAAIDEPTPAIIDLLGAFPSAKARPVYQRVLLSRDAASVIAAYQALYAENPVTAMASLRGALKQIKNPEQAFAISQLLGHRHGQRADGFYLKFAADLAADESFPMLARMVGIDAIMRQTKAPIVPLKPSAKTAAAFEFTVKQAGLNFGPYAANFQAKTQAMAPKYVSVIWPVLTGEQARHKVDFVNVAAQIDTADTLDVLRRALNDKTNWRVTAAAARGLGIRRDDLSKSALTALSRSHPIADVRATAKAALRNIDGESSDYMALRRDENNPRRFCEFKGQDFKSDAQQMPFFDPQMVNFDRALMTQRQLLTTAAATKTGWLAGYERGEFGGGIAYFDNKTGEAKPVMPGHIRAIIPTRRLPLGQYPSDFWVITGFQFTGAVYRVKQDGMNFAVAKHAELPSSPDRIEVANDQSVRFDFLARPSDISPQAALARWPQNSGTGYLPHAPLRLLPTGAIMAGCVSPKASNAAPKTLPN